MLSQSKSACQRCIYPEHFLHLSNSMQRQWIPATSKSGCHCVSACSQQHPESTVLCTAPNSHSLLQTPRERRIGAVLPGIAVQDDRLSLRPAPAHTWTHWSSRLVMTARAQTLDTQLAAQIVDGTGVVPACPRSASEGTCSRGARVHCILPHLLVWTRRFRPFCEANKRYIKAEAIPLGLDVGRQILEP